MTNILRVTKARFHPVRELGNNQTYVSPPQESKPVDKPQGHGAASRVATATVTVAAALDRK